MDIASGRSDFTDDQFAEDDFTFDRHNESHTNFDDGPHLIRIRGLPWSTSKGEILDFFNGVRIRNGENGIHLVTFAENSTRPLGEAYIELQTAKDLDLARAFDRKNLGTRYIEVFGATYEEFETAMNQQRNYQQENVLRLRGLPWTATNRDIIEFFKGLKLSENQDIQIQRDRKGKPTGEAFVQFHSTADCDVALRRNMEKIGHRYIEIFRSTGDQFHKVAQNKALTSKSPSSSRIHPYQRRPEDSIGSTSSNGRLKGIGNQPIPDLMSINLDFGGNGSNSFKNMPNNYYDNGGPINFSGPSNSFPDRYQHANDILSVCNKMISDARGFQMNNMSNNSNSSGRNGSSSRSEEFCIHLRGMPYYCDEGDIYDFFAPLRPIFCKVISNNKGLHSGEAKAFFECHADAVRAMERDRAKMGNRYIELFYKRNKRNPRKF